MTDEQYQELFQIGITAELGGVHIPQRKIINVCDMPTPAPRSEAEVYTHMRDLLIRAHCDAKRDHQCCGKITIDRNHITFNCPLCGDARKIL